jgi:hypothetical protein
MGLDKEQIDWILGNGRNSYLYDTESGTAIIANSSEVELYAIDPSELLYALIDNVKQFDPYEFLHLEPDALVRHTWVMEDRQGVRDILSSDWLQPMDHGLVRSLKAIMYVDGRESTCYDRASEQIVKFGNGRVFTSGPLIPEEAYAFIVMEELDLANFDMCPDREHRAWFIDKTDLIPFTREALAREWSRSPLFHEMFESVQTPVGDLRVKVSDDMNHPGISVNLVKPDGTYGTVCLAEVAGASEPGGPTLHTLAWVGRGEEVAQETVCDPDGPEMTFRPQEEREDCGETER